MKGKLDAFSVSKQGSKVSLFYLEVNCIKIGAVDPFRSYNMSKTIEIKLLDESNL